MAIAQQEALGSKVMCQVGLVVRDVEATARAFADLLGVDVPQWKMTDPEEMAPTRYRGEPTDARAKLAFFAAGSLSIELIEPVAGPARGRNSWMPMERACTTSLSTSRTWRARSRC